jgi:two-component system OmpR family response regulator
MPNMSLLVVDDNAALRKGLSVRLRANGYEVLFAEDAISATAVILMERPDLVILDLGLPGGDGFDVMERLHRSDPLAKIPVIVLTGREVAGNRNRALQAGAAAFFQKPMEDGTLLSTIRSALNMSRDRSHLGESSISC